MSTNKKKSKLVGMIKNKTIFTKRTKKTKKIKKQISNKKKSRFISLNKRITLQPVRDFKISRAQAILDILPAFTKFYNKLSQDELSAIKYYKGYGSYFQSSLLANKPSKPGDKKKLSVPFYYDEEISLRIDLFGLANNADLYFQPSLDIKELNKYIETSYSARIELLNRLDRIYSRPDCPKMTGKEILFRGMQANDAIKKLKVGDSYVFQNFISTTVDRTIAERFTAARGKSYPCVFILMDMKDIPFIYMPNRKLSNTTIKYSTFMKSSNIFHDLSEYTLPRNLEFTIERIEKKPISTYPNIKKGYYSTLENILKQKGYFTSSSTQSADASATNDTSDTSDTSDTKNEEIKKEIEKSIFASATHYYCRLKEWRPRIPLDWKTLSINAEFVLDVDALESWKQKESWFM